MTVASRRQSEAASGGNNAIVEVAETLRLRVKS